MKTYKIVVLLICCLSLAACVSKKKYLELEAAKKRTDIKLTEVSKENKTLADKLEVKSKETTKLSDDLDKLKAEFNDVKNEMLENNARKSTLIEELNRKLALLSGDHKSAKDSLTKMLARLDVKDKKYAEKQKVLKSKLEDLAGIDDALQIHANQLAELEKFLTHNFDKNNVSSAYTSINGGFLYVTFNPSILFKPGTAEIQPEGKKILKIIGAALESNSTTHCVIAANWLETESGSAIWATTQQRAAAIKTFWAENNNLPNLSFSISNEKIADQKIGSNKHEVAIILYPPLQNIVKFTE